MEAQKDSQLRDKESMTRIDNSFVGYDKHQVDVLMSRMSDEYSTLYNAYVDQNSKIKAIISSTMELKKRLDSAMARIDTLNTENDGLNKQIEVLHADNEKLSGFAKQAEAGAAAKYAEVFSIAQASADAYVKNCEEKINVKMYAADIEAAKIVAAAKENAEQVWRDAQKRSQAIILDAREKAVCVREMLSDCFVAINEKINCVSRAEADEKHID